MQRDTLESAEGKPLPLIDSDELAELLGIASRTVRELANQGQIPGYRVGSAWRFRAAEVLAAVRRDPIPETS